MNTRFRIGMIFCFYCFVFFSCSNNDNSKQGKSEESSESKIETFSFSSEGQPYTGKIHLPTSFNTSQNLPAIFLIDFTEQHYRIATDEFEKVVEGVKQLDGFDALVVSLDTIPNIDAKPEAFTKHYSIFTNMAEYVERNYTRNPSRTFIGRGSESGIVVTSLLRDTSLAPTFSNFIASDPGGGYRTAIINLLESGVIINSESEKKLHFSFSKTNNHEKCSQIIQLIEDAKIPGLQFKSTKYDSSEYENTYPISFADGIKFVFNE